LPGGFCPAAGFLTAHGFFAAHGLAAFVAHGFFAAHGFFTCAGASVQPANVNTPATAMELTTCRIIELHLLSRHLSCPMNPTPLRFIPPCSVFASTGITAVLAGVLNVIT
jgi:hypothetical protein